MRFASLRSVLCATFCLAASGVAHAQGSARSLDLDPSARASGMGATSEAVFWDEGTDHWGNPALLGYQRGVRYEWGRTRLVPGLAADVNFTTNVVKLGAGGLGVALSGKPIGVGGLHLSYGTSQSTDQQGNPTGTYESHEQIDSWSLGLSAARLGETIATLTGHDPTSWSRYADVSFGMSGKKAEVSLAPGAIGETSAHDLGLLVRLSPLEWSPATRDAPISLDLAYGWSDLSYDGEDLYGTPPSEHERHGFAGRFGFDPPLLAGSMGGLRWIWEGFHPLMGLGLAKDHARIGVPASRYETDGDGFEVTLLNVLAYRHGHYEDKVGEIDGRTEGWSVGLPIGRFGGLRYDHATFPQARNSGLENLNRKAASAWIDALGVWQAVRAR